MHAFPRCYVGPAAIRAGARVAVLPEDWHHLVRVLRLKAGDPVCVFDGAGRDADGVLESGGSECGAVRVGAAVRQHPEPAVRTTLFQALLKSDRMDEVVQKAVELGASALVPLSAAHSVTKLEGGKSADRLKRWRRIALGAARQSGNPFLLEVHPPVSVDESLRESDGRFDLRLFGALGPGTIPLWDALAPCRGRSGIRVGVWIGPEGDWSELEQTALRACGGTAVSLGPLVLRAETAAVYGLSVIGAAFLTTGSGTPGSSSWIETAASPGSR